MELTRILTALIGDISTPRAPVALVVDGADMVASDVTFSDEFEFKTDFSEQNTLPQKIEVADGLKETQVAPVFVPDMPVPLVADIPDRSVIPFAKNSGSGTNSEGSDGILPNPSNAVLPMDALPADPKNGSADLILPGPPDTEKRPGSADRPVPEPAQISTMAPAAPAPKEAASPPEPGKVPSGGESQANGVTTEFAQSSKPLQVEPRIMPLPVAVPSETPVVSDDTRGPVPQADPVSMPATETVQAPPIGEEKPAETGQTVSKVGPVSDRDESQVDDTLAKDHTNSDAKSDQSAARQTSTNMPAPTQPNGVEITLKATVEPSSTDPDAAIGEGLFAGSGSKADHPGTVLPQTRMDGVPLNSAWQTLAPRNIQALADAAQSLQDGPVDLALNPEELGHVKLRLSAQEGSFGVVITAERPETLDLLRRNSDLLTEHLSALGYATVTLEFTSDQPSGQRGQTASHTTDHSDPFLQEDQDQTKARSVHLVAPDRIDIRL